MVVVAKIIPETSVRFNQLTRLVAPDDPDNSAAVKTLYLHALNNSVHPLSIRRTEDFGFKTLHVLVHVGKRCLTVRLRQNLK
jgi:hypothetical protein